MKDIRRRCAVGDCVRLEVGHVDDRHHHHHQRLQACHRPQSLKEKHSREFRSFLVLMPNSQSLNSTYPTALRVLNTPAFSP
jgi:hypothetical protein